MNGQLYTNNTWRTSTGATVLQTVGTITQDNAPPTGTLYLRTAAGYITGIPDSLTFGDGPLVRSATITAHGTWIAGAQRIQAMMTVLLTDSSVTVDTCTYTVKDLTGRLLASGNLLLRNTAGDYWIIEYAVLEAAVDGE